MAILPYQTAPFHLIPISDLSDCVTVMVLICRNSGFPAKLVGAERQLAKLKADLPGTIVANVKNAQKRNVKI